MGENHVVKFYLWSRESVPWGYLCTHHAVTEHARGNLLLTPQESEILAAVRTTARQRYNAREKAKDITGFRKRRNATTAAYLKRHPEVPAAAQKKLREKRKEAGAFMCDHCNMSFPWQSGLEKHNKSQTHKNALAGIKKATPVLSRKTLWTQAGQKRAKEAKRSHCSTCDYAAPSSTILKKHNATGVHAKSNGTR